MLAVRVIHVPLICIKWLHCRLNIEEWPGMIAGAFTSHGLRGFAWLCCANMTHWGVGQNYTSSNLTHSHEQKKEKEKNNDCMVSVINLWRNLALKIEENCIIALYFPAVGYK